MAKLWLPPSGAILLRAQRVALSLFALCAKQGSPTALVQPCASLLWQAPTCHPFLQLPRFSEVQLDLCQFGHTNRRPTRFLLANVDPCDTQKLRRTCQLAMVSISFARAQALLTAKQVNHFRADCQLNFVNPWYKR